MNIFQQPLLKKVAENYLYYKSQNLSNNSLRAYRNALSFLVKELGDVPVKSIDRKKINKVINKQGAIKSKELRKSVFDTFVDWCIKEGFLKKDFETEVYMTRAEKNNNKILTISEYQLKTLLSGVDNGSIRDVLNVGFYMGLRTNELVHCRPAWIVKNNTFLRIGDLRIWNLSDEFHPKSQKEHDIPIAIPSEVKKVFDRYASKNDKYKKMFGFGSDSSLRYNLNQCFNALPEPISNNFTVHHLRHSCISYWLNERRIPIQEVQRLARHSRMETTMKYYHPSNEAHWQVFNSV